MRNAPILLTDRSRMAAYQDCPRKRFESYERGGTGIAARTPKLALAEGIWIHQALEGLLRGRPLEEVVAAGREELRAALVGQPGVESYFLPEQEWMLEVLLRAWARDRLPALLAEYEVVSVEQELLWEMAPASGSLPAVVVMLRVDALIRSYLSGGLYYLEFKTTSSGGDEWAKGWERNSQLLSNTLAIEETLREPCMGVLIEGLIKGRRAKELAKSSPFHGKLTQQGPLCYAWRGKDGSLSPTYSAGKTKVALFAEGVCTPQAWTETLASEGLLPTLFCPVPPILPVRAHLQRWRDAAVAQERRIAALAADVRLGVQPLHLAFPCHENQCFRYWGHPCEFEPLCFSPAVEADPLGSGLYEPRVPHHQPERSRE